MNAKEDDDILKSRKWETIYINALLFINLDVLQREKNSRFQFISFSSNVSAFCIRVFNSVLAFFSFWVLTAQRPTNIKSVKQIIANVAEQIRSYVCQ